MLTTVMLYGALGQAFGKTWKFDISTAAEAIRMIEANKPGFRKWIRDHLGEFPRYKVIAILDSGKKEALNENELLMHKKPKILKFIPIISGASDVFNMILGAILIVVGAVVPGTQFLIGIGIGMVVGGIIHMLSPRPKTQGQGASSYYFSGPSNNEDQGLPVPLIYGGPVMVGSQSISAQLTVSQLM